MVWSLSHFSKEKKYIKDRKKKEKMILQQAFNLIKTFDYGQFLCDEIFLTHPDFRDGYRQKQGSLNFANELHFWLLEMVIFPLETRFGAIRIETIPVKTKNGDAFCVVRVARVNSDRVFANMVHREIIREIQSFATCDFCIYYRLLENETLFENGNFDKCLFLHYDLNNTGILFI